VWALYNPSMSFLSAVGSVLVLGFGGQEVVAGRLGFGEFTAFLLLVGFLYDPIGKLHSLNQLVQSGRAAGERILEILDEKPEADEAESAPTVTVRADSQCWVIALDAADFRTILRARPDARAYVEGVIAARAGTSAHSLHTKVHELAERRTTHRRDARRCRDKG
jgi:ABC-type multidrug transport system fused ATPase/permease subunit